MVPTVWPDLAKFRHLGKILQVLGKIFNLLWQILYAIGQISLFKMDIWSHWLPREMLLEHFDVTSRKVFSRKSESKKSANFFVQKKIFFAPSATDDDATFFVVVVLSWRFFYLSSPHTTLVVIKEWRKQNDIMQHIIRVTLQRGKPGRPASGAKLFGQTPKSSTRQNLLK